MPVKATGSAGKYTMNDSNILCLQCGSLIENNISVCPFCSSEIDTKFYFRLVKKVQDYLLFGYEYRRLYEIQYSEKKKIEKKYHLDPPSGAFVWVGLAVLSGVIGNASWDFVKKVINKIRTQVDDSELPFECDDDKELKQLYQFLLDYHRSFAGVEQDVKGAIFEEMRAHQAEKDPPKSLNLEDKEELMKVLMKYAKRSGEAHRKSKISAKVSKGLWKRIEFTMEIEDNQKN